jgi:hypothetical protein
MYRLIVVRLVFRAYVSPTMAKIAKPTNKAAQYRFMR